MNSDDSGGAPPEDATPGCGEAAEILKLLRQIDAKLDVFLREQAGLSVRRTTAARVRPGG